MWVPATFEAAVIVLAIYLLTRLYTHSLGDRMRAREPLNTALVWHSCVHELPVLEGALIPVLALILAWAVGAPVASGASAALWAAAASISSWRSRPGGAREDNTDSCFKWAQAQRSGSRSSH
jgi:hypothetical protein